MAIPYDSEQIAQFSIQDRIHGTDSSGGFAYDVDFCSPLLTTAIHAGHKVRNELTPLMAISKKARQAEEDTATDQIIGSCPNRLWGLDSRVEYDLNRPPELALPLTPEMFWNTPVYEIPPTDAMNQRSLEKYVAFYRFAASVIKVLLDRFGFCVVYDIHSYNVYRQVDKGHPAPPMFNLGTRLIDRKKWAKPVDRWLEYIEQIRIPGHETSVAENDVFKGEGEFCRRLSKWDPNILILPTEISKVYMDERTGECYDTKIQALRNGLADAIDMHQRAFNPLTNGAW